MRILLLIGLVLVFAVGCSSESEVQEGPVPDISPSVTATAVAASISPAVSTPEIAVATLTSTPAPIPTGNQAATQALTPTPDSAAELRTSAPLQTPVIASALSTTPLRPLDLQLAFPNLEPLDRLVGLTSVHDGTNRLFLVSQPGLIVWLDNRPDVDGVTEYLDIRDKVNDVGNEEGLLGLVFDPHFDENRHFYVYYSVSSPRRSVISRFTEEPETGVADPASEHILMEVRQPFQNHNGGHLAFGQDGFLYIGLGDGGSAGDPQENAQNLDTLLGSILRIDVAAIDGSGNYGIPTDNPFVDVQGSRTEIWAYGFRNPWRYSFDSATGDLWVADVGQNEYEEVNLVRYGLNYGWSIKEGDHCYDSRGGCDEAGLESPVAEYGRDFGCSITGGYVYRGKRLPSLYGAYVYGDFCSGRLWALRHDGDKVVESIALADTTLNISSFGVDDDEELYVLSLDGRMLKFVPGFAN